MTNIIKKILIIIIVVSIFSLKVYARTLNVESTDVSETSGIYGGTIQRKKVENIIFTDTTSVPSGVIGSYDASIEKDRSIVVWYTDIDDNELYEVYVGSQSGVNAPLISENLFKGFTNVTKIDLRKLNMSDVTDINKTFANLTNLNYILIGNSNIIYNSLFNSSISNKYIMISDGVDSSKVSGITDKNRNAKTGIILTGDYLGSNRIAVLGDITSDGEVSPLDYIKIKNHIMGSNVISNSLLLLAADMSGDGIISPLDYVKVKNRIMSIGVNYEVSFSLNGGTGDSTSYLTVTKGKSMPSIGSSIPTRSGYSFMGWYDNSDYTKGTQYYNSQNASSRTYNKSEDAILYAGWKKNDVHKLSIKYNGNGGTWNNPSNDTYTYDASTSTVLKSGEIYYQTLMYGESLSSSGLIDYNGGYINIIRDNYYVPLGKEYYIQNGNDKTELDQQKVYTAIELSNYGGCDLSKNDCMVTVKVNFNKDNYIDITGKQYKIAYENISGWKGYPQNFAIANIGTNDEALYISASLVGNISSSNTNEQDHININTTVISKLNRYVSGTTNKNYTFNEIMYLKDSGHGQPFDYDTTNNTIITNDYKDEVTYGTTTYGSSTGIMAIKFTSVSQGGSYSKLSSYNLNMFEPMPVLDISNKFLGYVSRTRVKIFDYDYSKFKSGNMDFSSPKANFAINRADPVKYTDGSSIPSQGFTLYNNYLYEVSGNGGNPAYLEVFNLNGKSIYKIKLGNGYTTSNGREIEGIKIYNNKVYICSTYAVNGSRKIEIGYFE